MSSNSFSRTIYFRTITRLRRSKAVDVDDHQHSRSGGNTWESTSSNLFTGGGGK
jgi:hypothetical protein